MIPVKDEPYASVVVQRIHRCLLDVPHEILIQRENGYANAVRHGIQRARGDFIATIDADGSHSPFDLRVMVKMLETFDCDLVLAQRRWLHHPLYRRVATLGLGWLTRRMLGLKLCDPLSTFMVGKREAMMFDDVHSSKFTLEILARLGTERVLEYDVVNEPRKQGKSKNKPIEAIRLLKQLWRLRGKCLYHR